jgi:hypothetical protein
MMSSMQQMSDRNTQSAPDVDGLRRLWLAVIYQAVADASWSEREWKRAAPRSAASTERLQELRDNRAWALDWLNASNDYPNSFPRICEFLHFDPELVRDSVRSGRARRLVLAWTDAQDIARNATSLAGALTLSTGHDPRRDKDKQDRRRAEFAKTMRGRLERQAHDLIAKGGMGYAKEAMGLAEYLLPRQDREDLRVSGVSLMGFVCS